MKGENREKMRKEDNAGATRGDERQCVRGRKHECTLGCLKRTGADLVILQVSNLQYPASAAVRFARLTNSVLDKSLSSPALAIQEK